MRKTLVFIFILLIASSTCFGWDRDSKHTYPFYGGPTGGNPGDLDSISSASMMQYDRAIGFDVSGATFYAYVVQNTGVTTESAPYIITPDDLQAGGTGTGTSTWALAKIDANQLAGLTPYVIVEIDATAMAQITAATATAVIHASGFAYDSEVSAFVTGKGYAIASQTTAYVQSQVSGYPYNSNVIAWLTTYTNSISGTSLFSGITEMVTAGVTSWIANGTSTYLTTEIDATAMAQITAATATSTIHASGFAYDSEVTAFVQDSYTTSAGITAYVQTEIAAGTSTYVSSAELTAHTDITAFTGATDFATNSQVSAYAAPRTYLDIDSFAGVSDFATNTELTAYTAASAFTGATAFYKSGDSPIFDVATMDTGIGGVSKFIIYSGVTATGSMLGGSVLYWNSASMGIISLPTITGSTAFFVLKDIGNSGVTVVTENSQAILNAGTWGTKVWVPPSNLGHQIALTSVQTGVSNFWDVLGYVGDNWVTE